MFTAGAGAAAELAARARDQDLYVFAMCGVAYVHARNGDGELALSVLHQLSAMASCPAAQCYIAVYQAHAHASARRRQTAALALDRAAESSAHASDEAPSPWLGIHDGAFVQRQRAMITAGSGSPGALSLLQTLQDETPDVFQRYRVTLLTDQALAHALLGQVEQSAALLTTAAQRNQRIRSAEKTTCILKVRAALDQYPASSAVKAADQALQSAGTTMVPSSRRAGGR